MLANFFDKSKPVNFILIVVLFVTYYILDIFILNFQEFKVNNLYNLLLVTPFFLTLFFLYNFIISKNKLTYDNSYAFLLLVISIGSLHVILNYKTIGIYVILFLFLRKIYSLKTLEVVYKKLFDSGFWLGVLILLFPLNTIFILLIYTSIFLFLKITIRTILIPILGLITPIVICFSYFFFTGNVAAFYKLFEINLIFDLSYYSSSFYMIVILAFGVITLISITLSSGRIFSINNKFKRSWSLLLTHLVLAIVFVGFVNNKNGSELLLVSVPSTIIIANWLQSVEKKLLINSVLLLLLVLSFTVHFIT